MKTRTALSLTTLCLLSGTAAQAASADRAHGTVFAGKPLAPIAISYELDGEPAVGRTVEIALRISPAMDLKGGVLVLGTDDPLELLEPAPELALGDIAAGEAAAIDITVLPLIDQTQYLDVVVRGEIGGQTQVRTIAIAIRLAGGDSRKSAEPAPAQRTSAEAVQSLPAVESVY